eukprot:gene5517-5752_t
MTPLDKVFMLSTDDIIDRSDLVGLILVKELLAVVGLAEPGSGPVAVSQLKMRDLPALAWSISQQAVMSLSGRCAALPAVQEVMQHLQGHAGGGGGCRLAAATESNRKQ